ncbi:carbamoyltransferase [Paracidovorax anthurii]|uniref:Carbamoyltransferase n=1 Tax=Paracidovorax anthurii TaxID=78229 RepID=A0A328Z692_9BURK|nr:carbamoyltransferase [Paracidovorax anthurii]RAR81359.1 carbamoyltransferase [Paracidovorax anthurii]
MSKYVLGVSAYYHDSAAALVRDGRIVAAAQEERFTRVRHDAAFPAHAVRYCLQEAGISLEEVDEIAYYEDPKVKFSRMLASFADGGMAGLNAFMRVFPEWMRWKRDALSQVRQELDALDLGSVGPLTASPHHRSHAASAFYPSPYPHAAVLCIDGVGEWQTTSIWHGRDRSLELVNSISYPHSLGLLYSAFTYYCGFKVDSGEYKLMGLAPYGQPIYAGLIRDHLIDLKADGSFSLNLRYFEFLRGQRMVGHAFEELFGMPVRDPEAPLEQRHCDLAASVQKITEEAVLRLARAAARHTGERRLCLAGGVALNCVANGVLSRSGLFDSLWIQPAAGDAGGALGAALDVAVRTSGRPHLAQGTDAMHGALLGPEFSPETIGRYLQDQGYPFEKLEGDALHDAVARELAAGAVVGWFQGRMEFGPRALGARSIIGDPRNAQMQRTMNLKIKFRESFRPFAPAVLQEDAATYFEIDQESPYMLLVAPVSQQIRTAGASDGGLGSINEVRSQLPAVTHVDFSARVQTVTDDANPVFARLLRSFKKRTGCPVLVNTSFNVRGEPIVCTPAQAYACFMRTAIDILVLGPYLLRRGEQPEFIEEADWREAIPLD